LLPFVCFRTRCSFILPTANLDITEVRGLCFSFSIDFEAALAFRRARGDYLREYQYQPLEVEVYI